MLVVNRFRVVAAEADGFLDRAVRAREVLAAQPGYVEGILGRNIDDPELWVLTTRWRNVGSYRRALGSYQVKTEVLPIWVYAVDEPTAYELPDPTGEVPLNTAVPRDLDG